MIHDEFSFEYTAVHPGTDKTSVLFYDTQNTNADLVTLFFVATDSEFKPQGRRLFVTDENVASQDFFTGLKDAVSKSDNDALLILPPGETNKTIDNVLKIVRAALENQMQRASTLIGIGGGVICDMTAFAASLFKRGARLELVPTTLLAMVDASLGGKTGCDFDEFKNMIGTFYPASKIHIMSACAKTLSEVEYRSGLGEVFKTALLYAPKLLQIIETEHNAILLRNNEMLSQIIKRCVQAKAHIVERDLMESGLRMQLNFGHTFAHALETVTGLGVIPHGDAVAWGICRAMALSLHLGLCEKDYYDEVISTASLYGWETNPLPPILTDNNQDHDKVKLSLLSAMQKDKKNSENAIRFVLQREINSTVIIEVSPDDVLAVL